MSMEEPTEELGKEKEMREVTELIQALQARLKNAGGGEIIITDKNFNIKLAGNTTSFVSKTRNL
tara:strand:+ start:56 stop:247 length:192 start_codon:yes stop_codon:yes gene_type:complete